MAGCDSYNSSRSFHLSQLLDPSSEIVRRAFQNARSLYQTLGVWTCQSQVKTGLMFKDRISPCKIQLFCKDSVVNKFC